MIGSKMKNVYLFVFIALIALSCNKSVRDNDTSITMVEDYAYSELILNDVINTVERVILTENGLYKLQTNPELPTCATLTVDTSVSPSKIIINYGTTDCADPNGYIKKGKVNCSLYGKFHSTGSKLIINFENYSFNGNAYNGTITLKNNGKNAGGNYNYSVSLANGSITLGTQSLYYKSNRKYTYTKGDTTQTYTDDEWSVTGTMEGNGFNGSPFNVSIDSIVVLKPTCNYPLSGKATLDAGGNLTDRLIDFGSGNCDKTLTVTINGASQEITLK